MSALLELSSYKKQLSELISCSNMDDCELPVQFKEKFNTFGEYRIERYNRYTAMVSSKKSVMTIPNQWIFIAGCCCQYHLELLKYKNRLLELGVNDDMLEACHPSKDNKAIPDDQKTLSACKLKAESYLSSYTGEDKALLVDFLYNYDSWGGGKNIKRSNDFTESPVLNIANTINASSGLIGSIAKGLASQPECLEMLLNSKEWRIVYTPAKKPSNIEPFKELNKFADYVFKTLAAFDGLSSMVNYLDYKEQWIWFQDSEAKAGLFRQQALDSQTMPEPLKLNGEDVYVASGWDLDDKLNCPSFGVLNHIIDTCYSSFYRVERKLLKDNKVEFVLHVLSQEQPTTEVSKDIQSYLTAIRTKPFLLLAGISGTGKSRIVRKLAQATDTIDVFADDKARFSCHTPSNFCLIQVKPNWHNSMDVVGFKSNIGKDGEHYEFTPFVEFIAKAWHYPNVPFFLCLDEMNLAPVEEYFAEFLSAIESRSINEKGEYETDPIIQSFESFGMGVCGQMIGHLVNPDLDKDLKLENQFRKKGLTLPKNLIVMGTVNMDETTFSFSRKVLDRAMSIEMNEVDYDAFLDGKTEDDIPVLTDRNADLVDRFIKAQDVKDDIDSVKVKDYLNAVNALLEGTPFKLGYRAANEALLYVAAAKTFGNDNVMAALDDFTTMKILSRIEGDDTKLKTNTKDEDERIGDDLLARMEKLLKTWFVDIPESKSVQKVSTMRDILRRDHFVSYWG